MSDQLFDGTRLRILTIIDAYTRFSPAGEARKSFKADDVVKTLERVLRRYGVPKRSAWTTARNSSAGCWISGPA